MWIKEFSLDDFIQAIFHVETTLDVFLGAFSCSCSSNMRSITYSSSFLFYFAGRNVFLIFTMVWHLSFQVLESGHDLPLNHALISTAARLFYIFSRNCVYICLLVHWTNLLYLGLLALSRTIVMVIRFLWQMLQCVLISMGYVSHELTFLLVVNCFLMYRLICSCRTTFYHGSHFADKNKNGKRGYFICPTPCREILLP